MKIRTGFVSNSSSSSFCIMGMPFSYTRDIIEKIDSVPELTYSYGYENFSVDDIIVGLDLGAMQPDETLAQFRSRAKITIHKAGLIVDSEPDWCVDGGYNG